MNRFEAWMLKRLVAREVCQGFDHRNNLITLHSVIRDAVRDEFTEDNVLTTNAFLNEIAQEVYK